jgi:anti-sigma regulatory factor (Ser/Thr protein kinase)
MLAMTAQMEQVTPQLQEHAVQFYEHDTELTASVGAQLADALDEGAAAVVIATPEHRLNFERELKRLGVDPAGRLRLLDAAVMLERLTDNGRIDPEAFRRVIGGVVRDAARDGRTVWAYGEMVALLWAEGKVASALELEQLWNELQATLEFSLLCAYPSSLAADPQHAEAIGEVCRLHTTASHAAAARKPTVVLSGFKRCREAPQRARRFVAEVLRERGDIGLIEDASLIVSELATNAVVHARSRFHVALYFDTRTVTLSVSDSDLGQPSVGDPSPSDPHGRGLIVVDALADDWGCSKSSAGKSVWVELKR